MRAIRIIKNGEKRNAPLKTRDAATTGKTARKESKKTIRQTRTVVESWVTEYKRSVGNRKVDLSVLGWIPTQTKAGELT